MKADHKVLCFHVLLTFLVAPADIIAQDSSGMVVASHGEIFVISNGESRPLRQGDFIYEHDAVIARNRSFAVLQFVDGAKVIMHPNSRLIIEQYRHASGGQDTVTLNLVAGGMRVVSGAIASSQPGNYIIRTPLALMTIEGSEGSLTLCDEKICAQEGLVEITE